MIPGGSLAHLIGWRNAERPTFDFLWVEDSGPWTVGRLTASALDIERRLAEAGTGAGDRVLVRLGNDERFLPALAATWLRGAVAVCIHPSTPLIATRQAADDMGTTVVLCAGDDALVTQGEGRVVAVEPIDRRPSAPVQVRIPAVGNDEAALVLLTSGSSGKPKGVALSHGNLWANLRSTVLSFSREGDPKPLTNPPPTANLIANPLSHTGGLLRLLIALYVGRPVVLLRKFDAQVAKRVIDRHAVNNLTINPSMMKMLLDDLPGGADLGGVRYVSSGTAPLPPALRETFESRFGVPVLQSYGQTEASGAVAIENARDVLSGNRRPGSVGRPLPGMDVRVVDPSGQEVAAGEEGEITVRSASNTIGYLGDNAGSAVAPGGWLRTGDLGHLDPDGYLYVTGRLRSVIICGGFNVIPEEVEAALIDGSTVTDAVVVGLPDPKLGEIPVAVIEPAQDPGLILARLSERLAPYKRPRQLFSVDALPRLPIGKVDRPAVVRLAEELARKASDPPPRS